MTYQGARARPQPVETKRVYLVTRVRLDARGHVQEVLWGEVNPKSNLDVGTPTAVPVADVVDAIQDGAQVLALFTAGQDTPLERPLEVFEHADGVQTVAVARAAGGRRAKTPSLQDVAPMVDVQAPSAEAAGRTRRPAVAARAPGERAVRTTHAVSKVGLDGGGRVINVLWGEVDTRLNAWASPEVQVPVAEVVRALHDGEPVYALFPSSHGHMPDRRFVCADYDGGRETIVLAGPSAYEREVHDMDRLDAVSAR